MCGTARVFRRFRAHPGVKRFMDATRAQAREPGYVETVFGCRLYLPDIRSRNAQTRQYAERSAINAPMQDTAADIIKLAMIRVDEWQLAHPGCARLIIRVHDALVFEVANEHTEAVRAQVTANMEGAAELRVSLKVEAGLGANWDEAH